MAKIDYVAHGIPDLPFADPNHFKDEFGMAGRQVVFTFGLLSPNKGIEDALPALPRSRFTFLWPIATLGLGIVFQMAPKGLFHE